MPRVTVTITKNASLAAIARYISITTIYTVGYLKIFNAGHFFSVALPLVVGSASKTCQHHLEPKAVNVWDLVQSDQ